RRAAIFGGAPGVGVELGVRVLHHRFPRGSLLLRRLRHGVSRPPLQHWEATPSTPAQPAVRPPQGQRRRDGARPTRPHPLRRLRPPPRHRHRRQGRWHRLRPASRFGIDSGDFAALLCRSGLVAHCRFCRPLSARWIAFHGCYDFAYLIKVLGNGTPLPDTLEEFLGLVNLLFGETVDLKYMMFGCEGLSGGLESVASTLGATPSWEVASSWLR
ncbi:CCR4-associated factor, partial [Musa troglodytarum]